MKLRNKVKIDIRLKNENLVMMKEQVLKYLNRKRTLGTQILQCIVYKTILLESLQHF